MAHTNPLHGVDTTALLRAYAVLHHDGNREDNADAASLAEVIEQILAGETTTEIANRIAEGYGRSAD